MLPELRAVLGPDLVGAVVDGQVESSTRTSVSRGSVLGTAR